MNILLSGWARSGKNAVADILVQDFGYTQVALADAVRELAYELNPWIQSPNVRLRDVVQSPADFAGWEKFKLAGGRQFLIDLGQGARRIIGQDVWINALRTKCVGLERVVVSDVRFFNEVNRLWPNSSEVWRVTRLGVVPANDGPTENELNDYPHFHHRIENDGTLEDLREKVKRAVRDGS